MEFIQLTSAEDFYVPEIYASYITSFPEDERRDSQHFKALFTNGRARIHTILDDRKSIGYQISWPLTGFLFIEHLEVFPQYRGLGYGKQIISELIKNEPKIVLESEPRNVDETAEKRIQFYEKNNFTVLEENYTQPAYSHEKKTVSLWLLANWQPEDINQIIENIYDVVYK